MAATPTNQPADGKQSFLSEFPWEELRIISLYVIFGCLWIIFSDRILDVWNNDPVDSVWQEMYKGINFIATTGLILFMLLRGSSTRWRPTETGLYILCGCVWVIYAERLLDTWHQDPLDSTRLQTYKGLNFVVTTGAIFFFILRRSFLRRRQAEELSRQFTKRFELVARAATDAIFDWHLPDQTIWWSEGLQHLFGFPRTAAPIQFGTWFHRLHPDDQDRVDTGIHGALEVGSDMWKDEFRLHRQDGSLAYVSARGYVIRDSAGKAVRMVGGISDITERKQSEEKLHRSRRQLRALSARLESLREEERTRISREIHDELGQMLTGLKMDLRWIEKKLNQTSQDPRLNPILDKVIEASELVNSTITTVQKISAELRPGTLDNLGIVAAIKHEVRRFQERTSVACTLDLPEHLADLPTEAVTAMFRILQEALTNIARHAEADRIAIGLRTTEEHWVLEITDNGKGIQPADLQNPKSLGLLGMQERAVLLGGEVKVQPGPTGGTAVSLRIPRQAFDTSVWELP